jgi:hypothetical protein
MKQKSGPDNAPAELVLKNTRRQTRRQYSAEEKIRMVTTVNVVAISPRRGTPSRCAMG